MTYPSGSSEQVQAEAQWADYYAGLDEWIVRAKRMVPETDCNDVVPQAVLEAADALADVVRGIGPLALEDALAAYREARGARSRA